MGSGYDEPKKNTSSKAQKTSLNKTASTNIESAERLSQESGKSAIMPSTPEVNASFSAQEHLGNQRVMSHQADLEQRNLSSALSGSTESNKDETHLAETRSSGPIPSIDDEEFWSQLFGGDPAPSDPNKPNTTMVQRARMSVPWLRGWSKASKSKPSRDISIDKNNNDEVRGYRPSSLNRWAPRGLFDSEESLTLERSINLEWHHPINQSIKAARFIGKHSSNSICKQLSKITGPSYLLSSSKVLLNEGEAGDYKNLALQAAFSLSLASSSLELACFNERSSHPDIATSIILCSPLAKQLVSTLSSNVQKGDAQEMFKSEVEYWADESLGPTQHPQDRVNNIDKNNAVSDISMVASALHEVIGLHHIEEIQDPFNDREVEPSQNQPLSVVEQLDSILSGSINKHNTQYKMGALIKDTLKFSKRVSSMRYTYTRLANAVWLACGPTKYDSLYSSLKEAMLPLKVIARSAHVHLHLIELNIDGDPETAKKHTRALLRLPGDLKRELDQMVTTIATIAVSDSHRSYEPSADNENQELLLEVISSLAEGDTASALRSIQERLTSKVSNSEQELLLNTLHLAVLLSSGENKRAESISLVTNKTADLMNAGFHAHFAKLISQLIRQYKGTNPT